MSCSSISGIALGLFVRLFDMSKSMPLGLCFKRVRTFAWLPFSHNHNSIHHHLGNLMGLHQQPPASLVSELNHSSSRGSSRVGRI
ncbi:hypothetical protein EDC04DRAFT_2841208 [Pisolithus marmoratus]|nr:hypothetical protein EDC04DRAFT_2841208 [Pisolithus marmoratus]